MTFFMGMFSEYVCKTNLAVKTIPVRLSAVIFDYRARLKVGWEVWVSELALLSVRCTRPN